MTLSQPEPTFSRPRRPSRRGGLALLALLLAVAALIAWYLLSRPQLIFTNQLAAPIWIAVGQNAPVSLESGVAVRLPVSGGSTLVVQWNLARPLSADERPMGEELRGSVVIREPRGTMHQSATVRGGTDYFAPLITNASDDLLRVTVNAGLEGAVDCGCAVRAGAKRVFIGYYRLYRNSTVKAGTTDGRTATFRDLGPSVTASNGTVGLKFENKDLR